MKPTKKMLAMQFASNILKHLTNSAVAVRNALEDGDPPNKISVAELKSALGEKDLLVIEKVLALCIDDDAEKNRVEQRRLQREAKK